MAALTLALTSAGLTALAPLRAAVVLNEVMANNTAAVANGTGFPDYVELLNLSNQPEPIGGWSLTDDPLLPRKFVFPDLTLPPGGRLIVWCAVQATGTGLYAGFGLGAAGDRVQLYGVQGGSPLDEVVFGLQAEDLSLGRFPDGTGTWVLNHPTPLAANEEQPLSDTPLVLINEWMARPATGEDWLELYNADELPVALGGWVLTDQAGIPPANRPIPSLSFLGALGFVQLFASDLAGPDANHLDFKLSAGGETLTLYGSDRTTVIDRITFGSQLDQTSQGRVPDGGDTLSFFSGTTPSPGAPNQHNDIRVVINEVLSHTDPPLEDAIELHNPTAEPADISHWWLSDSISEPRKYRLPAETVIPPGGFAVFYDIQFGRGANGFSLNSYQGDRVVLSAGGPDGELTGPQTTVRFGALKNGTSIGRVITSAGVDFVPLQERTFGVDQPTSLPHFRQGTGRSNAPARIGPVVVNEIHYHPADSRAEDEFIELYNPTSGTILLFDSESPTNAWRFRNGITFDFPLNVSVPSRGFLLLVAFDPSQGGPLAEFRTRFAVPADVPILGPFTGRLSDTGETIELQHPDIPEGPDSPDAGFVPYELLERIDYAAGAPWPASSPGGSLQRKDAAAYGNEPLNWFAASPTPGRANAAAPSDTDGDGIPDDWERTHGLDPEDPEDAVDDDDDDEWSNRDEYWAGTDPQDRLSRLHIDALVPLAGGWEMTFHSGADRTYSVDFSPLNAPGSWNSLTNLPPGAAGSRTAPLTLPEGDGGFLRLTVPSSQ